MSFVQWSHTQIERALGGYGIVQTKVNPRAYNDRREVPRYSVREVALYFHQNPRTVYNWFFGRNYGTKEGKKFSTPIAIPAAHDPHGDSLSFYNLAEAHVLASTRATENIQIKLKSVRFAMQELTRLYPNIVHPLLSKDFETDGCDLFIRELEKHGEVIVNLNKPGQLGLRDMMKDYLKRIVRDAFYKPTDVFPVVDPNNLANQVIVISQNVGAGRPTIAGTGIRVAAIWHRANAGETPQELADDYGIDETAIRTAIDYFSSVKAA